MIGQYQPTWSNGDRGSKWDIWYILGYIIYPKIYSVYFEIYMTEHEDSGFQGFGPEWETKKSLSVAASMNPIKSFIAVETLKSKIKKIKIKSIFTTKSIAKFFLCTNHDSFNIPSFSHLFQLILGDCWKEIYQSLLNNINKKYPWFF